VIREKDYINKITAAMSKQHVIYTIGHSTHDIDRFIAMLRSFNIEMLADVRHFPGSRKFPHFNKPELNKALNAAGIDYLHLVDLGGRRKPRPDSPHTEWRNDAFRGYADHMDTDVFRQAIEELESNAVKMRTAYMCSEAVWWRCHRGLISDHFKAKGWVVLHIMDIGKSIEHPYTGPARAAQGRLFS
jgi:uncharacterized protein (DUF488 family)